nr:MAG TPA: hypothetical protein [Caudoviricetes sp.]
MKVAKLILSAKKTDTGLASRVLVTCRPPMIVKAVFVLPTRDDLADC